MKRSFLTVDVRWLIECLLPVILFMSPVAVTADESRQDRFFIGGDLGWAMVDIQRGDNKYSETWLYGALRAEYALRHDFLLGIEGSGWTDQDKANDPIAEDVLAFMVTARMYPLQAYGVFVKTGWGYAKHRYWDASTEGDTSGTGYLLAVGYDIYTGPLSSSLSLSYSSGDLDKGNYRALTFSVGFSY
jgi:hypothetical protein